MLRGLVRHSPCDEAGDRALLNPQYLRGFSVADNVDVDVDALRQDTKFMWRMFDHFRV